MILPIMAASSVSPLLLLSLVELSGASTSTGGCDESELNQFGLEEFGKALPVFPIDVDRNCLNFSEHRPAYTVCVHNPEDDSSVSSISHSVRKYEENFSDLIKGAFEAYEKEDGNNNRIFLDIGAGNGIHALYAAKIGYQVWAVEPLNMQLTTLYKGAELNGVVDRINILKNSVDKDRLDHYLKPTKGNIGLSMIQYGNWQEEEINPKDRWSLERVPAKLLQDIVDEIARKNKDSDGRLLMLLHLDSVACECKAVMGSPKVFMDPRIFIPYITMKWVGREDGYGPDNTPGLHPHCEESIARRSIGILEHAGYEAYWALGDVIFEKLPEASKLLKMGPGNLVWVHSQAVPIMEHVPDLYETIV